MMDIARGKKTFDVRVNDRNYKVGDLLVLQGWSDADYAYTNKTIQAEIQWIELGGFNQGIYRGFCVLGIKVNNYNF